jgi:hypothetical protein
MKQGTVVLIGAALIIGVLLIFASKNSSTTAATVLRPIAPGANSLGTGLQSTLESVGPDLENLIGVTPQGNQSQYSNIYTAGGTVPTVSATPVLTGLPIGGYGGTSTLLSGNVYDTSTIFGDDDDEDDL